MRNETWVIAAPRSVRTTIVANAADAGAEAPFGTESGPVSSVVVSLTSGSVRVEAHDRLDLELDVVAMSDRPLVARLTDDTFRLSYDFTGVDGVVERVKGLRAKDSADVVLRVPRSAAVKVSTVRADVGVQDLSAPVTVSTVDGAAELESVTGPVTVSTAAGRVSVVEHTGSVTAKTVSGPVHVAGQLSRADVRTASGDVTFEVAGGPAAHLTAKTVTSRVAVRVPGDCGVDVRARTVTGTVSFDGAALSSSGLGGSVDHAEPGATVFVSASTVSGGVAVSHTL